MADEKLNGFTPVQQRMLMILADGKPHTREELHACLEDELGALSNIQPHLTYIRRKIRPLGQDIICEFGNRRLFYRHIRLISYP
jgi:hypothetical protein